MRKNASMDEVGRPNPDILLRRLQEETAQASPHRGHFKIYLGYAAGVGKTYGMLEEAQNLKRNGLDVVIGLLETHGRAETEALAKGLETIPRRTIAHNGLQLDELDLDAVLDRRPTIVLVDELAHTNIPGSRHQKRFQDVEELLDAGISVLTTLNIQHVESAVDIVSQITGVRQQETVPDHILELADEIEVVDVSPEALQQRLSEGKVYIPPQAKQAVHHFFRKGNLLALRELALRYAAHRVDEDMHSYMQHKAISGPWPAASRIMVCVRPDATAEGLIRIAHSMAVSLDARWYAVYVESPQPGQTGSTARDTLANAFNLAEELGGHVVVLPGIRVVDTLLEFARDQNITLIIVSPARRPGWQQSREHSVAAELVRRASPIHVLVAANITPAPSRSATVHARQQKWAPTVVPILPVAGITGICLLLRRSIGSADVALAMLLPVVFSSILWGLAAGLLSSITAIVAFDLLFVPPYFSFTIGNVQQHAPTFLIFVIVAVVTSLLEDAVRKQETRGRQRERFISMLYEFSRDLMIERSATENLTRAARTIADAFKSDTLILTQRLPGVLAPCAAVGTSQALDDKTAGVALWTFNQKQPAGYGTETLSQIDWSFFPLVVREQAIGVLGIRLHGTAAPFTFEQRQLADAFANILALFMARNVPS